MIEARPWARNQRNNAGVSDYPADSQCRPTVTGGEFLAILAHVHGPNYPLLAESTGGAPEAAVIQAIRRLSTVSAVEWARIWGLPVDAPGLRAGRPSQVYETWQKGEPRSVNANWCALRYLLEAHGVKLADVSSTDVEVYADGIRRVHEPLAGGVKAWHAIREIGGLVDGMYSWRKTNGSIFSHFVHVLAITDKGLEIADPYGLCNPSGHPDRRFKLNSTTEEKASYYSITFLEAQRALGLTSRVHHIRLGG